MEDKGEVICLNRIHQFALVFEDVKKELEGKGSRVPKEELPEFLEEVMDSEIM